MNDNATEPQARFGGEEVFMLPAEGRQVPFRFFI
jgi:hypothetical protein